MIVQINNHILVVKTKMGQPKIALWISKFVFTYLSSFSGQSQHDNKSALLLPHHLCVR